MCVLESHLPLLSASRASRSVLNRSRFPCNRFCSRSRSTPYRAASAGRWLSRKRETLKNHVGGANQEHDLIDPRVKTLKNGCSTFPSADFARARSACRIVAPQTRSLDGPHINRSVRRLSSRPVRYPKPSGQGPRRPRRRSRCFRPCISWKGDCRTSSQYRPSRHSDRSPNDNQDHLCRRTRQTPGWREGTKRLLSKVATSRHQSALRPLAQSSQYGGPERKAAAAIGGCGWLGLD
jgi:hypothetical protein